MFNWLKRWWPPAIRRQLLDKDRELLAALKSHAELLIKLNDLQRKQKDLKKIIDIAHKYGWNGVENSKILATFLEGELEELADIKKLIDLQHTRTTKADQLWRQAHPGNDLVMPDLGALIDWLLSEIGRRQKALEPFAKMAALPDRYRHEDDSTCEWRIRAKDLRQARDVFNQWPQ